MTLRRPALRALLLGVLLSVAVTALSRTGLLAGWEARVVDLFLVWRDRVASPDIVLVAIDDAAFRDLGGRQPLPRRYLADLGDVLLRSGARVLALDIQLGSPSAREDDAAFVAMTRRWEAARPGGLVLTSLARAGGPGGLDVSTPFSTELGGTFGFTNAPRGADGVIRSMIPALAAGAGVVVPSFALATVAAWSGGAVLRA